MPGLLARIGIYVIVAAIALDTGLHYFGKFEYHFPFYGTFSVFLVPLGFLLILAAAVAKLNPKANVAWTGLFPTDAGPSGAKPLEPEPQIVRTEKPELVHRPLWTPFTAWVGVSMILLGVAIFAGGYYWRSTRTIVALDTELSLVSGHAKTPEFYVNVRDIAVHLRIDCWPQDRAALSKIRLTALRNGSNVAQMEIGQAEEWDLHLRKVGYYRIEVQFLPGSNCLKDRTLAIWVVADSSFYDSVYAFLHWFAVTLVPPGLVVIVHSLIRHRAPRFEVSNTATPEGARLRRWPLKPRFASLPSRGLISFWLAVPLIIAMWAHVAGSPIGFRVHLLPISQTSKVELATGTLTLRIDARKRYYLNSKLIPQEELANTIARLAWPAPPVVYLDADPNLEYQDVIAAIDTLRGLRANVVLLTRQPRNSSR